MLRGYPEPGLRRSISETIAVARQGLETLAETIACTTLGNDLERAVQVILSAKGRLVIVGLGKSGHIARKLAATFSSTGTASFFLHATEASHGDLGMIGSDDVIFALSWSGETAELVAVLHHVSAFKLPLIGMTQGKESFLARHSTIKLLLPDVAEACPHGLAPTTSCVLQLAVGDALALAVSAAKGFTVKDFRRLHPGGQLGHRLKSIVELIPTDRRMPLINQGGSILRAAIEMTATGTGLVGVTGASGQLIGVIDGINVGRHLEALSLDERVTSVMDPKPLLLAPELSPAEALDAMLKNNVDMAFVSDSRMPLGLLSVNDLIGPRGADAQRGSNIFTRS